MPARGNPKTLHLLDITVSSLISGSLNDCDKNELDQLSYAGVLFEWHILWTMQECKECLAESLDVQPIQ